MTSEELANWKIESLARAINWLTARATQGDERRAVLISQEDWDEFQQAVEGTFRAKESDLSGA
jgi:hypothetical protein